jgi:SAM-dependent methyltransferase
MLLWGVRGFELSRRAASPGRRRSEEDDDEVEGCELDVNSPKTDRPRTIMKNKLKDRFIRILPHFPFFRKVLLKLFPTSGLLNRQILQENFLGDYIQSHYDQGSLIQRRFYNIGAGSQRSRFPIWSYIDLKESLYDKQGIDIFYDLESGKPLPLEDNKAEVIFSSFVIEHISVAATKNLCSEAFRALKPGGVFHSKIHAYEYGYKLWKKGMISPKIPFECRESSDLVDAFIKKHKGKIRPFFDPSKGYVFQSIKKPADEISFSPDDMFLLHNATTAWQRIHAQGSDSKAVLAGIEGNSMQEFFHILQQQYINQETRQPHQHNADFLSQDDLADYIKGIGFSEVYLTQPYQSVAPVLWEDILNPVHQGFVFAIEAIK